MCVIFWTTSDPNFDLVIASNRDEFLARPTLPATWHDFSTPSSSSSSDGPRGRILSARDSTGGGTWLGVTENGAFATLTNFTELSAPLPHGMDVFESRGKLVRDWLSGSLNASIKGEQSRQALEKVEQSVRSYLTGLTGKLDHFPGFNLLVGAISSEGTVVGYITNRTPEGELVIDREPDIFLPTSQNGTPDSQRLNRDASLTSSVPAMGMSNSVLGQPWKKVKDGSPVFRAALDKYSSSQMDSAAESELVEDLYDLLWNASNPKPAQRSELRNSILIPPLAIPTATQPDWYATRTSTIILIKKDGSATFVERDTYKVEGDTAVRINGPEGTEATKGRSRGQRQFSWHVAS